MEALLPKKQTRISVVARTDGSRRGRSKLVRASKGQRCEQEKILSKLLFKRLRGERGITLINHKRNIVALGKFMHFLTLRVDLILKRAMKPQPEAAGLPTGTKTLGWRVTRNGTLQE